MMKRILLGSLSLAIVLANFGLSPVSAVGTDGSFENGTAPGSFLTLYAVDNSNLTGWTVDTGSVDYIGTYWPSADGARNVDLNGFAPGSISQSLTTVIGNTYDVSFSLSGNPDSVADVNNAYWSPSLKNVQVSATGVASQNYSYDTAVEGNSLSDMKWQTKVYSFVATATNTSLAFASTIPGAFGPAIDNVVITEKAAPTKSSVTMCKTDVTGKPLAGWTLMLQGEAVQTGLSVPTNLSAGVNSTALNAGTSYLAKASGTWLNQGGANPVDTEYSTTDAWATHMDGYTGYQTDILELQINSTFDPNSAWGAYNSAHAYAQSFVPAVNGPANFRIFDGTGTTQNEGWFADNSGSLNVDLYKGYAGITGENGCVTFSDVPYGVYSVGEILQDNWTNVSGLGQVTVNAPTQTFTVVNKMNEPTPIGGTISGMKYNDLNRNGKKDPGEPGLPGWVIKLKKGKTVVSTTTDANGNYSFTNLTAGTYKVRETNQKGWKRMSKNPKPIVIVAGSVVTDVNFGNALKKKHEKDDCDKDDERDE